MSIFHSKESLKLLLGGHIFLTSAKKDGVELIAVVLGAMGAQNRTNDTIALFEYGFNELKSQTFLLKGDTIDNLEIPGAPSNNNMVILSTPSANPP